MDQTLLPFVLEDNLTYNVKGADEVWSVTAQSGPDKRQCTIQLTVFADGNTRLHPLIIFKGIDLRISAAEKKKWDSRVSVTFQEKAWGDEKIMKHWIKEEWGNIHLNSQTEGSTGNILYADVHVMDVTNPQNTSYQYTVWNSNRVQPLDVSVNKAFKNYVQIAFEKHLNGNMGG